MRLVDDEHRRVEPVELGEHPLGHQPLRRQVEELCPAVAHPHPVIDIGGPVAAGMDAGGVDAVGEQSRHLVVHQRHQRRDNHRQSVGHQGRKLVAERLAEAGRHDAQRVGAIDQAFDDFLLSRPEGGKAEGRLQQGLGGLVDGQGGTAPGTATAARMAGAVRDARLPVHNRERAARSNPVLAVRRRSPGIAPLSRRDQSTRSRAATTWRRSSPSRQANRFTVLVTTMSLVALSKVRKCDAWRWTSKAASSV